VACAPRPPGRGGATGGLAVVTGKGIGRSAAAARGPARVAVAPAAAAPETSRLEGTHGAAQASICLVVLPLPTLMRFGLALSATGMRRVSTPSV
jgi:hypothetical protein